MTGHEMLSDLPSPAGLPVRTQAPTLPPIPPVEKLDYTLPSDSAKSLGLFTIPSDIRQLIYNAILPLGPLIILRIHAHTTLLKHLYALSQTCHTLHTEIASYLTTRPLTILCNQFLSPNIMNGIPPRILAQVETLAIEDSPATEPNWALLRNISTICLTEIYDTRIQPTPPSHATVPPALFSLPTNNTVLAHAHRYWQNLRLEHDWIRRLWKRDAAPYDTMPHIRVVLRRVFEAQVEIEETRGIVVAWHGVVDVDSRKVLENRYLATRGEEKKKKGMDGGRKEGEEEEYLFPYAAQTWWRREIVVKG